MTAFTLCQIKLYWSIINIHKYRLEIDETIQKKLQIKPVCSTSIFLDHPWSMQHFLTQCLPSCLEILPDCDEIIVFMSLGKCGDWNTITIC